MDQIKIGKLIAKLRKEKGLTQKELGDMVGVGYRAVSKWERGINLPDIAIINELSEILGITSDELLKGELNNKQRNNTVKTKHPNKKLILLLIPIVLLLIILIKENRSRNDIYIIERANEGYFVEGKAISNNNNLSIFINKIEFEDYEFNQTIIKNYEYKIISGKEIIYGFGYNDLISLLDSPLSINEFSESFKINYDLNEHVDINKLLKNNLTLRFTFIDENDKEIIKNVEMKLVKENG